MDYVGLDIHKRYAACAAHDELGRKLGVGPHRGHGQGRPHFIKVAAASRNP
jgi:hypothetical protein